MPNNFSWLLALRRGLLPGALGAGMTVIGIVAGKLSDASEGKPVTLSPDEADVIITLVAAGITGLGPVVKNVAKHKPNTSAVLKKIAVLFSCFLITVMPLACVTTTSTLPDGTVVVTKQMDAAAAAMLAKVADEAWTEYRAYKTEQGTMSDSEAASRQQKIQQLIELYKLLRQEANKAALSEGP